MAVPDAPEQDGQRCVWVAEIDPCDRIATHWILTTHGRDGICEQHVADAKHIGFRVEPIRMNEPPITATLEAIREVSSSVEITQDAQGKLKFIVKVYCEAGLESEAATKASQVLKQLREEHGL